MYIYSYFHYIDTITHWFLETVKQKSALILFPFEFPFGTQDKIRVDLHNVMCKIIVFPLWLCFGDRWEPKSKLWSKFDELPSPISPPWFWHALDSASIGFLCCHSDWDLFLNRACADRIFLLELKEGKTLFPKYPSVLGLRSPLHESESEHWTAESSENTPTWSQ